MKTTIDLDEELLARAAEYCGIKQKRQLIHAGLKSLIARGAAAQLAEMGGRDPDFQLVVRDRKSGRRRSRVAG